MITSNADPRKPLRIVIESRSCRASTAEILPALSLYKNK
jgi:hypothetical protein